MGEFLAYQYQPRFTQEELDEQERARQVGQAEPHANPEPGDADANPDPEGRLINTWWCECGHCQEIPKQATLKMCICCQEQKFAGLREKLNHQDYSCITMHEDFRAMCLTAAVLRMMVAFMRERRGYDVNEDWSNRLYRLLAYRSYTYWIHQRLGRKNRRVIPACVVNTIREQWPEVDPDMYVSYKEAEEELQDAWAL